METGFYVSESAYASHKNGDTSEIMIFHYNGVIWSQKGVEVKISDLPSDLTFL